MPWPQILLHVSREEVETAEQALFEAGALSVSFLDENDQPVLEPAPGEVRLWDELQLVALFAQGETASAVKTAVCRALGVDSLPDNAFSLVPDRQWERVWMDRFQPMKFGRRLWVCPTHLEPPEPEAVNLRLDPGLAFGTGTHATTALCLEWLDSAELEGKRLLDFGCGSGVLAIAALLLGASAVAATDIDPQAMQASRSNAELNRVDGQLNLVLAQELVDNQYDILLANILFQPLCELRDLFAGILPANATIVMSGILEEQVSSLQAHYSGLFKLDTVITRDGWARVSGTRI
ncbi:MAG: 50S ribosomal protein L11 methyltransferase [Gammaproteobacteria bacterium]|nr:50S ribosomal protein L11 methyltransferase [Gammaproteobacteria bacterium]